MSKALRAVKIVLTVLLTVTVITTSVWFVFELRSNLADVADLVLELQEGKFGVNPANYMGNDYSKLFRPGYYAGTDNKTVARDAVMKGLTYNDYDQHFDKLRVDETGKPVLNSRGEVQWVYAGMIPASVLYSQMEDKNNIGLWVGKDYVYDRVDDRVFLQEKAGDYPGFPQGYHPAFTDASCTVYVKPTVEFASYSDIDAKIDLKWNDLLDDSDFVKDWLHGKTDATAKADFKEKVKALWIYRIGCQTDNYVAYKAKRMEGGGEGAGIVSGAKASGIFKVPEIRFDMYDSWNKVTAMAIQSASSGLAAQILGPILCSADFEGVFKTWDAEGAENQTYSTHFNIDIAADYDKITVDELDGPWAPWKQNRKTGTVPTQANIQTLYNNSANYMNKFVKTNVPTAPTAGVDFSKISAPKSDLAAVIDNPNGVRDGFKKVCEFGLPAGNKTQDIINLQTIKSKIEDKIGNIPYAELTSGGFYRASFALYGYTDGDGKEWRYVSVAEGESLGGGMGADYIRYTYCNIKLEVWPSGLIRTYFYDAPWKASLLNGLAIADVAMANEEWYSYDAAYITGSNGMIVLYDRLAAL